MNNYLIYLLEVSICFTVLYALFYMFFRKLTFHKTNRILLLLLLPLSLLFPVLDGIIPLSLVTNTTVEIPDFDEFISFTKDVNTEIDKKNDIHKVNRNIGYYLLITYLIGCSIYIIRFFISILKLYFLKKKSIIYQKDGCSFVLADIPVIFSCFHWIFIPEHKIDDYQSPIINHEKAHVRLLHTLDLIFVEMYVALFWFNPVVYFFRKSIKSIHEFQADQAVVNEQIKKSDYLKLLFNHLGATHPIKLYSYFNHPIIKKRIDMITKTNSKITNWARYILLLPVLLLLIMAFAKPNSQFNFLSKQVTTLEIHKDEPPSIFPIIKGTKNDITHSFGRKFKHPIQKKKVIHGGIDIRATIGTEVVATANGTISTAKMQGNWGNLIIVSHANGYETYYAHLDGFNVKEQQQVKKRRSYRLCW